MSTAIQPNKQQGRCARPGNLAVLGSTGSIGTQTLDIVRRNPDRFSVISLSAKSNIDLLEQQIKEFKPVFVAVQDQDAGETLRSRVAGICQVQTGPEAVVNAALNEQVHTVVAGVVGFAGLRPVAEALRVGKHVAQANKEVLVAAAGLIRDILAESNAMVVPVDSEHNSLFQCLLARGKPISRATITASGGPFWKFTEQQLRAVTPEQAVRHPNWAMGPKNSIDSASLMNKALEVIEAAMLFDLAPEQIKVLIHPQSILHGMVEYEDGTAIAALYQPDMRVPIGFAVEYLRSENPKVRPGDRVSSTGVAPLNLAEHGVLEFFEPDDRRFPALELAYQALRVGGSMPTVLNAANEVAVEAFIEKRLSFVGISRLVESVMKQHQCQAVENIDDIMRYDASARVLASNYVEQCTESADGSDSGFIGLSN